MLCWEWIPLEWELVSGYTEDYRDKCAVTLVRKQIFINSEHFYQTKLFSFNEEIDPDGFFPYLDLKITFPLLLLKSQLHTVVY